LVYRDLNKRRPSEEGRRGEKWVRNVEQGKEDLRRTLTKAEPVEGGVIVPGRRGLGASFCRWAPGRTEVRGPRGPGPVEGEQFFPQGGRWLCAITRVKAGEK
jgi:hypothetical protein